MRIVTLLAIITFSFIPINVFAQDKAGSPDANATSHTQETKSAKTLKTDKKDINKIIQLDAITVTGTRTQETQLSQALKID